MKTIVKEIRKQSDVVKKMTEVQILRNSIKGNLNSEIIKKYFESKEMR